MSGFTSRTRKKISGSENVHSSSKCFKDGSEAPKLSKFDLKSENVPKIDVEDETDTKQNSKLHFYRHQVAGHYPIFWKSGVICKPIQKNELEFYLQVNKNIPSLVPFVPKYMGVVEMEYGELPPTPTGFKDPKYPRESESHTSETAGFNRFNQWGLRCHQKKKKVLQDRPVINYIELEDLTLPFSRPNILDLKIGTRVYGVNDDPQKIKRKMQKSAATTSHTLGLRLCGMQVYNSKDDGYVFRNKFYGRDLDEIGLSASIREFFTNEGRLRRGLISDFIQQIKKLLSVISKQKIFQFFSSSLLFICEGCRPSEQKRLHGMIKNSDFKRIDLRFIDFAQAAQDTERKGVDEGFLRGLKNIVNIMQELSDSKHPSGNGTGSQTNREMKTIQKEGFRTGESTN